MHAIHALACALGKTTVAEGVETSMQLQAVQDIGCDLVQGFLTGRPVPLAELLAAHVAGFGGLIGPGTHAGTQKPGRERA